MKNYFKGVDMKKIHISLKVW